MHSPERQRATNEDFGIAGHSIASLHSGHFFGSQLCFFRASSGFGLAYGALGQHAQHDEKW